MNTTHLLQKFPNDADLGKAVRKATLAMVELQKYVIENDLLDDVTLDYGNITLKNKSWELVSDEDLLTKLNELGFTVFTHFDEDRGNLFEYIYKF